LTLTEAGEVEWHMQQTTLEILVHGLF